MNWNWPIYLAPTIAEICLKPYAKHHRLILNWWSTHAHHQYLIRKKQILVENPDRHMGCSMDQKKRQLDINRNHDPVSF
jgi:hypothetical protein